MKDFLLGLRLSWALRPRSPRALDRIRRRNASDPRFWEESRQALGGMLVAAMKGDPHG